jgi:hypothetical protein
VVAGGNLFLKLVNACYERCAMIVTGNRDFGECAGDAVVATSLLDGYRITRSSSRSSATPTGYGHAALIPS